MMEAKVWMLLSVDSYQQFESFHGWWLTKPSMKMIEDVYNPKGHSPTKSLLSDLWAGKPIVIGVDTYILQQVSEGFH